MKEIITVTGVQRKHKHLAVSAISFYHVPDAPVRISYLQVFPEFHLRGICHARELI